MPRYDDHLSIGGAVVTSFGVVSAVGGNTLVALAPFLDSGAMLYGGALVATGGTFVASVGMPLWIVGSAPGPDGVGQAPETRSPTMGAMGVAFVSSAVTTVGLLNGGLVYWNTHSSSEDAMLGILPVMVGAAALGATQIAMGITLIVHGFEQVPEEEDRESPSAMPELRPGPGTVSLHWRW